jgi:hypothetical protein
VLVDGQPRVACVTPVRRVAGRSVTTVDGLPHAERSAWVDAFVASGASQCGFCTPGIIVRLAGTSGPPERALAAHLCRCTGWRTILDAAAAVRTGLVTDPATGHATDPVGPPRDLAAAARRASIEGHTLQAVGPDEVLGRAGFADDTSPPDALVAVPDGRGGWAVAETLADARRAAGKVQGRRTTVSANPPLELPPGDWDVVLRTSWVDPGYLEPDASWCVPGGDPASPLGNGGAFGGKCSSIVAGAARRLADEHGRPMRVLLSREDTVRLGPKRPPIAAGVKRDGTGVVRVVRTPGIADAIASVAPGLVVEQVDVPGPPTSTDLRGSGWVEAAVLLAALESGGGDEPVTVNAPNGSEATALVTGDGSIRVGVACGDPLDDVVLRSCCIGAAHMAYSWVTSEALAVDDDGVVHDLTIRSFGIVKAADMPAVYVDIVAPGASEEPVNGSDAVFAAVAAAVWRSRGRPPQWPCG